MESAMQSPKCPFLALFGLRIILLRTKRISNNKVANNEKANAPL